MNHLFRRLLHRAFFVLFGLATLVVLFYVEEDWRGSRTWSAARRAFAAQGEPLELKDLAPPAVPDDQNLAFAPLFVRILQYQRDPRNGALTFAPALQVQDNDTLRLLRTLPPVPFQSGSSEHRDQGNWSDGHRIDLAGWQRYYRQRKDSPLASTPPSPSPAADVLWALKPCAPLLDELARAAAERPLTRFPVNWTLRPAAGINLPAYNTVEELTAALRLRACARLAAGQTDAARADVALMLRLRGSMDHDPTTISALVSAITTNLLLQPVWEGMQARQWSAADLDFLRESLLKINLMRAGQLGLRGERATILAELPGDLQNPGYARETSRDITAHSEWEKFFWQTFPYYPRGWYELDAAQGCSLAQAGLIEVLDPTGTRVLLGKVKAFGSTIAGLPYRPTTLLTKISLGSLDHVWERFAQAQAEVSMATTACSLEKYYLDHHVYPVMLTELVPSYLDQMPVDVVDGAPLRYRLTADGRYQLYSVGWDERDDGGTIMWPTN